MPNRPAYWKPKHQPKPAPSRPSTHAMGYDKAWERLRKYHLSLFPLCFNCGGLGSHVDHRVPVTVDPSRRLDPENLRTCCKSCHSTITAAFRRTGNNELPQRRVGNTHISHSSVNILGTTQEMAGRAVGQG